MCSEFFLAIIYFSIIFGVNFFLYKLLRSYFFNILYFFKLRKIFRFFNKAENKLILLFYFLFKKETQNTKILMTIDKYSTTKDKLIIGNFCKYINKNLSNKKTSSYFQLLEKQYLN